MNVKAILSCFLVICCSYLAPLWAQGEQIVQLKDMNLSMKELAEEASRQSGILVILDVVEKQGPRVQYDCSYSLKGIVTAIKGYYKFRLGLELEERWDKRSVTLKPAYRKVEVTDVTPMDEVPTKKEVAKKPREASFISRFWKRLSSGERENEAADAESESATKIRKFEIIESEQKLEMGGSPVDPVGEIPSRLRVETVVREDDVVDLPEDEVIDLFQRSPALVKEAPMETQLTAPSEKAALIKEPMLKKTESLATPEVPPVSSDSSMELEDLGSSSSDVVMPAVDRSKIEMKKEIDKGSHVAEEAFPDL